MRGTPRRSAALLLSVTMLVTLAAPAVADDTTMIHAVQGTGSASPLVGSTVTVEGVVVGDLQGSGQWGGFYLQEEDADAATDPAGASASEGIFVAYTGTDTLAAFDPRGPDPEEFEFFQ